MMPFLFRIGWVLCALLAAVRGVCAGEPPITRQGGYWVQTETGIESIGARGKLRVTSLGGVSVRGGSQDRIFYSVIKRVKARNEEEARRLLDTLRLKASRQGDYTILVVRSSVASADLLLTAPRSLHEVTVRTSSGAIDAIDLDGLFRADTGAGRLNLDRLGGNVDAKTAGGDVVLGSIAGNVRCISGAGAIRANRIGGEAVLETGGGEIVVQQAGGSVRCSTAAGGIRIVRAGGPVVVDTAGGPIDVGSARGMVTAINSGGPIDVKAATGVRCESAGGGVRLSNVSGNLRVSTAVGSIIAYLLAGQPAAESFLTTGAGDITLWVPSNLRVSIRAQNDSAGGARRIVSEFPGLVVKTDGPSTVAEGKINGGGPLVRVALTNGTIYIRRQGK